MKKLFIALLITVSSLSSAAMPKKVLILGTVESVAEKTVTLKTQKGSVKVPRKMPVDKEQVSIGESVRAEVTLAALKLSY